MSFEDFNKACAPNCQHRKGDDKCFFCLRDGLPIPHLDCGGLIHNEWQVGDGWSIDEYCCDVCGEEWDEDSIKYANQP